VSKVTTRTLQEIGEGTIIEERSLETCGVSYKTVSDVLRPSVGQPARIELRSEKTRPPYGVEPLSVTVWEMRPIPHAVAQFGFRHNGIVGRRSPDAVAHRRELLVFCA